MIAASTLGADLRAGILYVAGTGGVFKRTE